ncbi:MAG: alpha/beta fold hydrolase [Deltaproteobacteria bacterium]|nr:MAG: alpha/beta fold hydrolase [Deltaproteobacteria bacterium]
MKPSDLYHFARGQLGSIRGVYLHGNAIETRHDLDAFDQHVLLLHGFFQTRAIFATMEQRLRQDGFGVVSFDLGGILGRFNSVGIDPLGQMIGEKIERLCVRYGLRGVHVIGHSKGGLVARRWVQHLGGVKRVRSVITLGTPHHGTPTAIAGFALGIATLSPNPRELLPRSPLVQALAQDAFPSHIPLTSVYSRHDLVCPWWCSVLHPRPFEEHLSNVEVLGPGHSELCNDPHVYAIVLERLRRAEAARRAREGVPAQQTGLAAPRRSDER